MTVVTVRVSCSPFCLRAGSLTFYPPTTVCLAFWCPCMAYGKNKSRYNHLQEHNGQPHPDGGDCCNSDCFIHGLLDCCGIGWVMQVRSSVPLLAVHRILPFFEHRSCLVVMSAGGTGSRAVAAETAAPLGAACRVSLHRSTSSSRRRRI
jgi:hypothetical protein